MKKNKLNKGEKTFKELGVDLSSYKPTVTQELPKYHSCREVLNSPAYKKGAKDMEEIYEEQYADYRRKMIAKLISVVGKKKRKK